jgi:DNA modification methylase
MHIERLSVDRLVPAGYNPRAHLRPGDPEYESLRKSLDEFGLVEPLVWNRRTGTLVGGHQRLGALIDAGFTEVEVSVVDLPIEREKALNLALNKIQGRWDNRKLAELLDEIMRTPDLDLALTGFAIGEARDLIGELLGDDGPEEQFDMEAALAMAGRGPSVTQPGDLIILGTDPAFSHRLLCGDATSGADVQRLMDGHRAILFATDPPYLVDYDGTNHPPTGSRRRNGGRTKDGSRRTPGNKDWSDTYGVTWDDADANSELYDRFIAVAVEHAIAPHAAWYCWHASKRQAMLERAWNAHGAFVHCQIIWAKQRGVLTRTWYSWQHEPCFMGWLQGNKPPRVDDAVLSTVWSIPTLANGAERPDHPTPKPLPLFEIPMTQHTHRGEVCYEPFAGSGTQVIAAQRLGRRCFAMEVSPVYCDLIVRRFIAMAGPRAVAPEIAERYRLVDQPAPVTEGSVVSGGAR